MRTKLSVNLNKVALLRNQRANDSPNLLDVARIALRAGADGITVHPRPDGRHAKFSDVRELSRVTQCAEFRDAELNVEGYPSEDFLALVREVVPEQVTLVPDLPDQRTSDHGWDVGEYHEVLCPIIAELSELGSRVSLFVEPNLHDVRAVGHTGVHRIELYTEDYARAFSEQDYERQLQRYCDAAQLASEQGIGVNAGHDLNLKNIVPFRTKIPTIAEMSIGHALTVDALQKGFSKAVSAYHTALS